jgi:hypothetical protein
LHLERSRGINLCFEGAAVAFHTAASRPGEMLLLFSIAGYTRK